MTDMETWPWIIPVATAGTGVPDQCRETHRMRKAWLVCLTLALFLTGEERLHAQKSENAQSPDEVKADAETFKRAKEMAEKGDVESQVYLAMCYTAGWGVQVDQAEAAKWTRKAADQGRVHSQHSLGYRYATGLGVPQDFAEAAKWYSKAADKGVEDAQYALGELYLQGKGIRQDYTEAAKWYRKAADQGNILAQCRLGGLYLSGRGVPQNDLEAYIWFSLASAHGDEKITKLRDGIAEHMSRGEVVEGQRRATAFVPTKVREIQEGEVTRETTPTMTKNQPKASGTGFFITEDGFLVTNEHVVRDSAQIRLVTGAGVITAKVVKLV